MMQSITAAVPPILSAVPPSTLHDLIQEHYLETLTILPALALLLLLYLTTHTSQSNITDLI